MQFFPVRPTSLAGQLLFLFTALASGGAAQAGVVTQTVSIAGQNYFDTTSTYESAAKTLAATFDKFDGSLGTLTGVSFSYAYNFLFDLTITGQGGGGGGIGGVLRIDGTPLTEGGSQVYVNGTFGGSGASSLQGTTSVDAALFALFAGPGSLDFQYANSAGFSSGGLPGFTSHAKLDLQQSSATVTYTYANAVVNAVPEPASLALVGLAGFAAFTARRRRTSVQA